MPQHRRAARAMGLTSLGAHAVEECDVRSGDHIYAYRDWGLYSHHGIAFRGRDGRLWVYHFRGDIDKCVRKRCTNARDGRSCYNVAKRTGPDGQSAVVLSCIDCFSKDHTLHRHAYSASREDASFSRSGSFSSLPRDSGDEAVRRAQKLFQEGFGEYVLETRNCEQFALYCCTGRMLPSDQIRAGFNLLRKLASSSS